MNDLLINALLNKLTKSKFRGSFHLNSKMKEYVRIKGMDVVKKHAYEIVKKNLGDAYPKNDGKQTTMRQVHPVFIAQHACACCCRNCLNKWHHIPKGRKLSEQEIRYIVRLIVLWIERETA